MLTNLKVLIERFANSTSSDDWFDSINQIYRDANEDPELKGWFKHLDTYVRKCLKEQGYVMQDDANNEWDRIYNQGNFLLRERYRNHTDRVVDESKFLADQFDNDPQNKAFADAMNKLFNDLGHDENGKPKFKKHLLKDLGDVILPAFFENVRYIPIPRIEYSDPMADAVIENLVIEGDNLAPNVFEFGSDNYFRWGRKSIKNQNKNKVMVSVSGIQMDLRGMLLHKYSFFTLELIIPQMSVTTLRRSKDFRQLLTKVSWTSSLVEAASVSRLPLRLPTRVIRTTSSRSIT